MLLGSPPDMVHGTVLSRASRPVIKGSNYKVTLDSSDIFDWVKNDIRNIITDVGEKIKG